MSDEFIEGRSLRGRRSPVSGEGTPTPEEHDPMTDELPFTVLDTTQVSEAVTDDNKPPRPPTPSHGLRPKPEDPRPEPPSEVVMRLPRVDQPAEDAAPQEQPEPPTPAADRPTPPPEDDAPPVSDTIWLAREGSEPVRVKRPEDTIEPGEPVDAEVMWRTEDELPPAQPEPEPPPPEPEPQPPRTRWGAVQVLMLVGFVLVTLLILFVPGVIATLFGEVAGAPTVTPQLITTDVPAAPTGTRPQRVIVPTEAPEMVPSGVIAFSSDRVGSFDIYLIDVSSGEITQLTEDAAADRSPAWSPDGEQLLFVSDRSGSDDLYVMDADGGDLTRLTTSPAADRSPAWSPDGERVVFMRETPESSVLYTFDVDCMAEEDACEDELTLFADERFYFTPHWSPEGDRITASATDFPGLPSVITLLGGPEPRPLQGTGSSDFYPRWSPQGARIAFVSAVEGSRDLFTQTPEGGSLNRLTTNPAADVEPAWSPDGVLLVFASDRAGSFDLYICPATVRACEARLEPLTEGDSDDLNPAWRP